MAQVHEIHVHQCWPLDHSSLVIVLPNMVTYCCHLIDTIETTAVILAPIPSTSQSTVFIKDVSQDKNVCALHHNVNMAINELRVSIDLLTIVRGINTSDMIDALWHIFS